MAGYKANRNEGNQPGSGQQPGQTASDKIQAANTNRTGNNVNSSIPNSPSSTNPTKPPSGNNNNAKQIGDNLKNGAKQAATMAATKGKSPNFSKQPLNKKTSDKPKETPKNTKTEESTKAKSKNSIPKLGLGSSNQEEEQDGATIVEQTTDAIKSGMQALMGIVFTLFPALILPVIIIVIIGMALFALLASISLGVFSSFDVSNNHLGLATGSTTFSTANQNVSEEYLDELSEVHDKYGNKIDYDMLTATLFSEQHLIDFSEDEIEFGYIDGMTVDGNGNIIDPDDPNLTEEQKDALEARSIREKETIEKLNEIAKELVGNRFVIGTSASQQSGVVGMVNNLEQHYLNTIDQGVFTSDFGPRDLAISPYHYGVDFASNIGGSGIHDIISPISGKVISTRTDAAEGSSGYGNYVQIEADNGTIHTFAHFHQNSITLEVGDEVLIGTVLGKMGTTGNSTGVHIHHDVKVDGTFVDPIIYFQDYGTVSPSTVSPLTTSAGDDYDNAPVTSYYGPVKDLEQFYYDTIPGAVYTSPFGPRWGRNHNGVDFAPGDAAQGKHDLLSPVAGEVVSVDPDGGGGFGSYVKIKDSNDHTHLFAHMSYHTTTLQVGDVVNIGSVLGKIGSTGNSTGSHVHHEVMTPEGTYVEPLSYFSDNDLEGSGSLVGQSGVQAEVISLEDWHETDYYEYLVNDFIPDYFSDTLPEDEAKKQAKILEMADLIYETYKQYKESLIVTGDLTGRTCQYTSNSGETLTNVKVELLECWGDSAKIDTPLVDLEKYITGVVYAEVGAFGIETHKVQSIAARSYLFTRGDEMPDPYGTIRQEDGYTVISIRNCTADQVYCDPDLGCWSDSSSAGDTVYSGRNSSAPYDKPPLSEDSEIRKAVEETVGQVLVNSENKILYTTYTSTDGQNQWGDMEESGMGYQQIIVDWYEQKNNESGYSLTSSCITEVEGLSVNPGEYEENFVYYSQRDYPHVPFGTYGTFEQLGCAPTSYAMVASTMLGKTYLPTDQLSYICPDNCTSTGTTFGAIESFAEEYPELEVSGGILVANEMQKILDALESGEALVLAATHNGITPISNVSHSIVLTGIDERGNIKVADPWSRLKAYDTYTVEEVLSSVLVAWIVTVK